MAEKQAKSEGIMSAGEFLQMVRDNRDEINTILSNRGGKKEVKTYPMVKVKILQTTYLNGVVQPVTLGEDKQTKKPIPNILTVPRDERVEAGLDPKRPGGPLYEIVQG